MNDANSTVTAIKHVLQKIGWIDIPSHGFSMFPLIHEGNICRFKSLDPNETLVVGDVILFVSNEGNLVAHRYIHCLTQDDRPYYVFKGDTNVSPDPPVKEDQLIGKLYSIKKSHFKLNSNQLVLELWKKIVLSVPPIPILCKELLLSNKLRTWIKGHQNV